MLPYKWNYWWVKYLAIFPNSWCCWREFKLGPFQSVDVITCSTNHHQTSHKYGIMCINMQPDQYYIQSTTFKHHSSSLVPLSHFFIRMYQFLSFSQISTMWTLYQGISWTLPLLLVRTKLRISQLVQCSHQFQLPLWKKWVRCINQDGRLYPHLPRVRWHNTFIAETLHYQYQWMASSICSLHLSNCQEATFLYSQPHGIQILILETSNG